MIQHQAAAAAICLYSMIAPTVGYPAVGDYLTVAADLLAWHADALPSPRDLTRYACMLAVVRWRSRASRSTSSRLRR